MSFLLILVVVTVLDRPQKAILFGTFGPGVHLEASKLGHYSLFVQSMLGVSETQIVKMKAES